MVGGNFSHLPSSLKPALTKSKVLNHGDLANVSSGMSICGKGKRPV